MTDNKMSYINLDKVSVEFPVPNRSARQSLIQKIITRRPSGSERAPTVRGLDQITLNFKKGDRVGLIGQNGAGKTTLLRTLAGVYPPTSGSIDFSGRIAPLFDISLGFDFESTGFENIILRGLFLGLSKKEINERVDGIVNFTGLGDFLEMPLRTYSSGMLMRLAFAIATEIQPDIILMDEWIGVGDARFLEQAKQRLEKFIDKSNILVLASHSESIIRSICDKAVLLGQGQVLANGPVDEVFDHYNFFGSSSFFSIEAYVDLHPDLKDAMNVPGMAPWMHFVKYGIFEGRSPRSEIPLEAFSNDKIFNHALALRDGLAAAERIETVAPFLKTFNGSNYIQTGRRLAYPDDFIASDDHPLISREEANVTAF
jgi:ABC-type polysaccharide/polyol phosphate transport system ATPase subunit